MRNASLVLLAISTFVAVVAIVPYTATHADDPSLTVSRPVKEFNVTVDYMYVSPGQFDRVNSGLISASDRDPGAKLMAALIKDGVADSKFVSLHVAADTTGQTKTSMTIPMTTFKNGVVDKSALTADTIASAKPHLNPDGTITAILMLQKSDFDADSMSVITDKVGPTVRTFGDGQTLMMGGGSTNSKGKNSKQLLFFVKIASA